MFNDTHLSDADRKAIHDFALGARELLEAETSDLLEGAYGLKSDGKLAPLDHLPNLAHDPEGQETFHRLGSFLDDEVKAGLERREAVEKLVKEVAFTHLNRLVAFKMMEARKLIRQTVSRGRDSNGFKFYLVDYPEEHALWQSGDAGAEVAYRHFLLWQSAQVAREIKVVFDPTNLPSRLFPRPIALGKLLDLLNAEALAPAWASAETIGWIYQYFNEREKDEVFERLYKKKLKIRRQDIPAATQLFTPRWIVRFLVENTLGRTWLQLHPNSRLVSELRYLVPLAGHSEPRSGVESRPTEPLRLVKDITLLDPACGTMHFGLVAFDLFAEMYHEELARAGEPGWPARPSVANARDIPAAILAHNLFGIDIDLRAVQLSALTLYLKAKELEKDVALTTSNLACADVLALNGERLNTFLREMNFQKPAYERLIRALWARLKDINQLGSLLRLEAEIEALVQEERERYDREGRQPDLFGERARFESEAAQAEYWDIVQAQLVQAFDEFARRAAQHGLDETFFAGEATKGLRVLDVMLRRYDCVTTNPPYMGIGNTTQGMVEFLKSNYEIGRSDLYAAFILRCGEFLTDDGHLGMITQQSFMFIAAYAELREYLERNFAIEALVHAGPHAFQEISGEVVNTVCFTLRREPSSDALWQNTGSFIRLVDSTDKQKDFENALAGNIAMYHVRQSRLKAIPGTPWAYWIPESVRRLFELHAALDDLAKSRNGINTGDNFRFMRFWWECGLHFTTHWKPFVSGGAYRKWYGNLDYQVNLNLDELRQIHGSALRAAQHWLRTGITYPKVSGKGFNARFLPEGYVFSSGGNCTFVDDGDDLMPVLAALNSHLTDYLLRVLNPTLNFQTGDVERLPIPDVVRGNQQLTVLVQECIRQTRYELTRDETTFDFIVPPSWITGLQDQSAAQARLAELEHQIDDEVYRLYGISDQDRAAIEAELRGNVEREAESVEREEGSAEHEANEDQESLHAPPSTLHDLAVRWISYAVGIVMGRFQPGIAGALGSAVYRREDFAIGSLPAPDEAEFNQLVGSPERFAYVDAQGGRHVFSAEIEAKLRALADDDGIVVLDEGHPGDLPTKVETALELMLGEDAVERIALSIEGGDRSTLHSPRATFRRFLEREFFIKWHVKWYRKRPVYWLLQSPKKLYGIYLFRERMTKDTLFLVQRKRYLEGKITLTQQLIAEKRGAASVESGARERRALNKEADEADKLLADLNEFAKRLKAVTDRGYEPNIDDGVILNMAPLWDVVPAWSKEPQKYWDGLERGEYDWAHIAMRYWPARVREKCKTDKSLAIAHGLA